MPSTLTVTPKSSILRSFGKRRIHCYWRDKETNKLGEMTLKRQKWSNKCLPVVSPGCSKKPSPVFLIWSQTTWVLISFCHAFLAPNNCLIFLGLSLNRWNNGLKKKKNFQHHSFCSMSETTLVQSKTLQILKKYSLSSSVIRIRVMQRASRLQCCTLEPWDAAAVPTRQVAPCPSPAASLG